MFRDLFNIPIAARQRGPTAPRDLHQPGAPAAPPAATLVQREGAFVTTQSLVSFAGATTAVTVIANVVEVLIPRWNGSPILVAAISLIVGLTIYLISESDPQRVANARERIIAFIIAIINSCVIFSAAIGAERLIAPAAAAPNDPVTEVRNVTG